MTQITHFTGKKLKALEALLQGMTVPEVATVAEVSTRQVYRWLEDSDFSNALIDEQEAVLQRAGVRLAGLVDAALSGLADVLDRPDQRGANVKRLAARDVLELCLKWREQTEFAARLNALEDRLDETHR